MSEAEPEEKVTEADGWILQNWTVLCRRAPHRRRACGGLLHLNRPSCWRDLPFSSRTAHTAACRWIPTRYFPAPGEPPSPSWAQIQRAAASVFAAVRDACLSEHVLRLLAPCTTCPPPDRAVLTAICAGRAAHGVTPGPVCSATEKPHIPPHCGAEGTGRKRNF